MNEAGFIRSFRVIDGLSGNTVRERARKSLCNVTKVKDG